MMIRSRRPAFVSHADDLANGLNPSPTNASYMKRLAARTLAKWLVIGATFMAFGPVGGVLMDTRGNVAAAQGTMSSKEGSELLKKLDEPIKQTKKLFDEQLKIPGNTTVGLSSTNVPLRTLWLDALSAINTRLGKQVFDLTGADAKTQFESLTKQLDRALNRAESSPFDNACIEQVKKMATKAVGDATSTGPLAAALAGVAARPAGAQQEEEAPGAAAGPVQGGATPKKQGEPEAQKTGQPSKEEAQHPLLGDQQRADYQSMVEKLRDLAKPKSDLGAAATQEQRNKASTIASDMEALLKKKNPTDADLAKLSSKNAEGQALIDSVSMKNARKEAEVPPGAMVSVNAEAEAITQSLRSTTGPIADSIRSIAYDTAFCGETAARSILHDLRIARDALLKKDEAGAKKGISDAKETFQAEQAAIRRGAQIAIDFNHKNAAIDRSSGLPNKDALLAAETADHIPKTVKEAKSTDPHADAKSVEARRYYHTSKRGATELHNTAEEVASEWDSRAEIVERYMAGRTKVSWYRVASHLFPMRPESRSDQLLVDGLSFATSHGLDTADSGKRKLFWQSYSALTMVMRDPNYDVFDLLPAFDQKDLIDAKRRELAIQHPGKTFKKSEVERRARDDLRQNHSKKLAIATQNYINNVIAFSSEPTGALSSLAESWATLRSQRAVCEADYQTYLDGIVERYDDKTKELVYDSLTDQHQRARVLGISEKLRSAISAATIQKDDPVILAAKRWLSWVDANKAHIEDEKDETIKIPQMVAFADNIYQMTVGILAISEATMFLEHPEMRPSTLSGETIVNARATLEAAKRVFFLNFQDPDFTPTYYPLIPRKWADDAINMLAPMSHRMTDDLAYYTSMTLYNGIKDIDAPGAYKQTTSFAKRYFMMLIDSRDNAKFGVPALLAPGGKYQSWDYLLRMASFETGRSTYESANVYQGHRRPTESRTDEHKTILADQANARLAQRAPLTSWHEQLDRAYFGAMWGEQEREVRVFIDKEAPAVLRQQRYNPATTFGTWVGHSTMTFGEQEPAKSVETVNSASTQIVGDWVTWGHNTVTELMNKYGCKSEDELVQRLRLVDAKAHPEVRYVFRALEMLHMADELYGQYNRAPSGNFLDGKSSRSTPAETIKLIQVAMADLTDAHLDNLKGLPEIPKPPVVSATFDTNIVMDPPDRDNFVRARVTGITATVGNTKMTAQEYLKQNPNMEIKNYWMWVTAVHGHIYLRNKHHDPTLPKTDPNSQLFMAELLPTTGGFVVVKAVRQADGHIRASDPVNPADILFYTDEKYKPRMDTPQNAALVDANKRLIATPSNLNSDVVPKLPGTYQAVMFPLPREKTPTGGAGTTPGK